MQMGLICCSPTAISVTRAVVLQTPVLVRCGNAPSPEPLQRCLLMGQRLGSTSMTKSAGPLVPAPNFESDHTHMITG